MKRLVLAAAVAVACKSSARPPSLDEAISVEQPGGSAAQLFSQGTEIPTSATEMFTTAKDDEPLVIPEEAIVVPGSRAVTHPAGQKWGLSLYTAVIVKYRDEKTQSSIELEDWLR